MFSVVGLAALFARASMANTEEDTSRTLEFIDVNGWSYYPATNEGLVVGFLSVAPSSVPETSLKYVWWPRNEGGSFDMKAVEALSVHDAICEVQASDGLAQFLQHGLADTVAQPCEGCDSTSSSQSVGIMDTDNGLLLDDPFQIVAPVLTPEEIELAVTLGAAGAASLSQLDVSPSMTGVSGESLADDLLKWMAQTTEGFAAGDWDAPGGFPEAPATLMSNCSTVSVYSWTTATTCAGGGCRYTGTRMDITCCQVGGTTTCTTTTAAAGRTCPGACTSPPRPTCR